MNRLQTIDADTLQSTAYEPVSFVVDDLLPQGLHLLACLLYTSREIRRRTRVVGTFPDGNSALMLVCARLRHVAGTQWGCKKYMNMKHLEAALDDASIAG